MILTFLLLVIAMIFNVTAQLMLKSVVNSVPIKILSLSDILYLMSAVRLWLGAALYGGSFLFYMIVLSRGELSRIGPVSQALNISGLFIVSTIVFHESISMYKVFGLVLLAFGIVIISIR